jgi:hypothetical protein
MRPLPRIWHWRRRKRRNPALSTGDINRVKINNPHVLINQMLMGIEGQATLGPRGAPVSPASCSAHPSRLLHRPGSEPQEQSCASITSSSRSGGQRCALGAGLVGGAHSPVVTCSAPELRAFDWRDRAPSATGRAAVLRSGEPRRHQRESSLLHRELASRGSTDSAVHSARRGLSRQA